MWQLCFPQLWGLAMQEKAIHWQMQWDLPSQGPWPHRIPQNHRMAGVGSDLWRLSRPTPLLEQAHPEQGAQEHVQAGFEYLQGRDSTASLGSLFHCSGTLTGKNIFSHIDVELPVFQHVPIAPSPVIGHH